MCEHSGDEGHACCHCLTCSSDLCLEMKLAPRGTLKAELWDASAWHGKFPTLVSDWEFLGQKKCPFGGLCLSRSFLSSLLTLGPCLKVQSVKLGVLGSGSHFLTSWDLISPYCCCLLWLHIPHAVSSVWVGELPFWGIRTLQSCGASLLQCVSFKTFKAL